MVVLLFLFDGADARRARFYGTAAGSCVIAERVVRHATKVDTPAMAAPNANKGINTAEISAAESSAFRFDQPASAPKKAAPIARPADRTVGRALAAKSRSATGAASMTLSQSLAQLSPKLAPIRVCPTMAAGRDAKPKATTLPASGEAEHEAGAAHDQDRQ